MMDDVVRLALAGKQRAWPAQRRGAGASLSTINVCVPHRSISCTTAAHFPNPTAWAEGECEGYMRSQGRGFRRSPPPDRGGCGVHP
jgi:hypothetical protein